MKYIRCDNCGAKVKDIDPNNYCPFCGNKNGSLKLAKYLIKKYSK